MDRITAVIIGISIMTAGYFIGGTIRNSNEFNRFVLVKGLSEREVNADVATWPIQIVLTGNDLPTITKKLNSQKNTVVKFLADLGFTQKELTIGATNVVDMTANNYNKAYRGDKYSSKAQLMLRTHEITKIQEALEKSLELMATKGIIVESVSQWQPIQYSYSKLNTLKPEMIEEATKNAKKVAKKFADDSNSKVGKIKNAKQGVFSINNLDYNTPHIKRVRVVSTIQYYLED